MDFLMQNPDELIRRFSEFLISQENIESIYGEVQGGAVGNILAQIILKYKDSISPKRLKKEEEKEAIQNLVNQAIVANLENSNAILRLVQELLDGQNLPQQQAEERYQSYLEYLKGLYLQDDLFNSTEEHHVSLAQLYIDPYFEYYNGDKVNTQGWEKATIKLPKAILDILNGKISLEIAPAVINSQFILLLGQPGQGKSSFCKRFLHDYIQQNLPETQKIFYLRLRDLNQIENLDRSPYENLAEAIEEQMRIALQEEIKVKDFDLEKALLVLDGLDELQMVKEKAFDAENAVRFCDVLIEKIRQRKDWGKQCPRILLTSRFGRVNPSDLYKKQVLILRLASLDKKQQIEWTQRFAKANLQTWLTKELIKKYHEEKRKHLLELMEQPILLNMIAKLPKAPSGDLKRSQVYKALFDTLINRPYDAAKKLKIHESLLLDENSLRLLIQETAFAIFQSGREYIHKEELVKTLSPKLQQFFAEAETNPQKLNQLRLLMMSFYMQERPRAADDYFKAQELPSDFAIEFVHKSLQEYMTAEYIWETIHTSMREKSDLKGEYVINKLDSCLDLLAKLFAKKRLSREIVDNLIEIIDEIKSSIKKSLSNRLGIFFDQLLANDFLHPDFTKYFPTPPIEQGTNTFYGYWTIFAFGQKDLKRFFKTRTNWKNFERFIKLLTLSYYYKCNLRGVDLSGADLRGADLRGADLSGADLSGADLITINLDSANLTKVNLTDAKLGLAILAHTNLIEASLIEANLFGAYLIGADLHKANLHNASLVRIYTNINHDPTKKVLNLITNLTEAKLTKVDLRGAELTGADLSGADLRGAVGMSKEMKEDIKKRGGIVDEAE